MTPSSNRVAIGETASGNPFAEMITSSPATPEKTFMRLGDGRTTSYADLHERSSRYANALAALGIKSGDRIAVQVEKSHEALFLYVGCLRAGAIFLPLNSGYTKDEIDYLLGDAEPSVFVRDPDIMGDDFPAVPHVLTMDRNGEGSISAKAAKCPGTFANVARAESDIAVILYTSGTTGKPKGAMLTHGNLVSNARTLVEAWRFTPDDILVHALPIYHAHGLLVAVNVTLAAGSSMIFLPKFVAEEVCEQMSSATVLMGVPTFYTRLLKQPDLSCTKNMRLFISGSAPLLAETHDTWRERTGHAILERYGMTETIMSTSNPYEGDRIAGTVGFPLPGVEARVVDPASGKILAAGETGILEVRGPNVFRGYWRAPEKTAAEFGADGFFNTGDVSTIDDRGYVRIVGRAKDLIITGGFNVYPKEVEELIDAIPGVSESAVVGIPHPDFGEAVTAVIVRIPGRNIDEKDIAGNLSGKLAKYKQPKACFFVEELPRNTMGKVQKNLLRERYKDRYGGAG